MAEDRLQDILKEVVTIRKLMIAAMLKGGMSQDAIGIALGKNQSSVSRMIAGGTGERKRKGKQP